MTLLAYHGLESTKAAILAQLSAHRAADDIVKGTYWEDGKGCAVGCTLHSGHHIEYEFRFGIPQMLARLEDCIFEGLPNGAARLWPERFMGAIRPGADLSRVGWQFQHWLLTDSAVNPGIGHPTVQDAVRQCAGVVLALANNAAVPACAEIAARSAWIAGCAGSAAWSAESAAGSAAWSARSAAWSAESAENAESAARSARSARSAAGRSARSAAWVLMADKLISLLGDA